MVRTLLLSMLVVLPALATEAARKGPSDKDRAAELAALEGSRAKFLEALNGLSDAQWSYKPAADVWSVGEVAEHVTLAEARIAAIIQGKVMKAPPAPPDQAAAVAVKDELIPKAVPDRSRKFKAPEAIQPKGTLKSRDELLAAYSKAHAGMVEFVKSNAEDPRAHVMEHPGVGPIDGHQWILFMAAHTRRHTAQIEEVKAGAGFPKP